MNDPNATTDASTAAGEAFARTVSSSVARTVVGQEVVVDMELQFQLIH